MILLGVLFLIVVVPGIIPPPVEMGKKLVSAQHTIISLLPLLLLFPLRRSGTMYKTTCVELFVSQMMVDEETLVIHYNYTKLSKHLSLQIFITPHLVLTLSTAFQLDLLTVSCKFSDIYTKSVCRFFSVTIKLKTNHKPNSDFFHIKTLRSKII